MSYRLAAGGSAMWALWWFSGFFCGIRPSLRRQRWKWSRHVGNFDIGSLIALLKFWKFYSSPRRKRARGVWSSNVFQMGKKFFRPKVAQNHFFTRFFYTAPRRSEDFATDRKSMRPRPLPVWRRKRISFRGRFRIESLELESWNFRETCNTSARSLG